jgi:hypothetical protein
MHLILRVFWLFWGLLGALAVSAQPDTLPARLLWESPADASVQATADALGQVYTWSPTGTIRKYSADGRHLSTYSTNRYGLIRDVDVSNPMQVLVWFADFRVILLLDRNLTEMGGPLHLLDAGYAEVRTVAAAADGMIWVYDEAQFRLRKIRPDGTLITESQELNLLLPDRLHLSCLRDDGSWLLAADSTQGMLIFDTFGQYRSTLNWLNIKQFVLSGGLNGASQVAWLDQRRQFVQAPLQIIQQNNNFALPTGIAHAQKIWIAPQRILTHTGTAVQVWAIN